MRYFLILPLLIFCNVSCFAQVWSNNGAVVSITSGTMVKAGSFANTSGAVTNDGTLTLTGDFTNAVTVNGAGNYFIGGNWNNSGTFTGGTGAVTINGTAAQSIGATIFTNLTINKTTGTASLSGNCFVNGDLSINAGTLDMLTYTIDRGARAGTMTMLSGTNLYVGGANNFPDVYHLYNMDNSSSVIYNGTMAQTVAGINYANLIFSNGSANAKTAGTPASVSSNITINSGATFVDTSTLQIAGTITNSGTFTADKASIELNGSSAQTIPASVFSGNNLKGLTINNTAGVSLSGALNLTDVLTIANGSLATNGYLTLKSTATGTARVAQITSASGTPVTGNVIAERYVQGRRKYRLITSAVTTSASATLIAGQEALSIWGNWQNAGVNLTPNVGTLITGGNGSDGFDAGTPNASLFTYDDVQRKFIGYTTVAGKNTKYTPLKAGIAYLMFVYGDRLNSVGASSPHNTVLVANGTLKTGDQAYTTGSTIPLSGVTGRFTLLGNPFESPIDWAVIPRTNMANTYWGWDPNLSATGGYITVTTTGTVTLQAPYSGSTGLNQYIQPGQGFFVKTTGASPTLTIREQDKVSNFNALAFRMGSAGRVVNNIPLLAINLQYVNAGTTILADGVLAAFDASFSSQEGTEDAVKMANTVESMSILVDTASLSIDAMPLPQNNDTLYLNTARLTKSSYNLQIFSKDLASTGIDVFLQDRYLNTLQALSLTDTNNIAFSVSAGIPASSDLNRFRVVFHSTVVALPVTYTSINASRQNKDILVEWQVAEENGILKYEIERSADGNNFSKKAEVTAIGNNSTETYQWLDTNPLTGNNYYRVRGIQADGKMFISKIVSVKIDAVTASFMVSPNPVRNQQVNIRSAELQKGKYSLQIFSSRGQQIINHSIDHPGGPFVQTISLNKILAAGIYYLQVSGDKENWKQKIIIE